MSDFFALAGGIASAKTNLEHIFRFYDNHLLWALYIIIAVVSSIKLNTFSICNARKKYIWLM